VHITDIYQMRIRTLATRTRVANQPTPTVIPTIANGNSCRAQFQ